MKHVVNLFAASLPLIRHWIIQSRLINVSQSDLHHITFSFIYRRLMTRPHQDYKVKINKWVNRSICQCTAWTKP